jgi:hypothetical protein
MHVQQSFSGVGAGAGSLEKGQPLAILRLSAGLSQASGALQQSRTAAPACGQVIEPILRSGWRSASRVTAVTSGEDGFIGLLLVIEGQTHRSARTNALIVPSHTATTPVASALPACHSRRFHLVGSRPTRVSRGRTPGYAHQLIE